MSNMVPVRVCGHCGAVGHSMDTYCLRCQRRGTLDDRFQCPRCSRLTDDEACPTCLAEMGIRPSGPGGVPVPLTQLGEKPLPDLSTHEPPPWLTGLLGGIVFGVLVGFGIGAVLGEEMWVTAGIGAVLGGIVGAVLTGKRT